MRFCGSPRLNCLYQFDQLCQIVRLGKVSRVVHHDRLQRLFDGVLGTEGNQCSRLASLRLAQSSMPEVRRRVRQPLLRVAPRHTTPPAR